MKEIADNLAGKSRVTFSVVHGGRGRREMWGVRTGFLLMSYEASWGEKYGGEAKK